MIRLIATAAFALAAGSSFALELNQVPAHVIEVAKHYAPDAEWTSAGTDYDGQLMEPEYEITGTMNGSKIEVDVSPEGMLHEVETAITASDVPQPTMTLLNAYLPGFTPMSARPNGVTFYEFEGTVDGREVDIEVNAQGTEIIIADDAAI